ncbi:hypothetical protein ASF49_08120 [Methylobacterium sp. Leaf104]|uniref:major capsid protein n=1 Tax=Methylobacterium TaxID=407 RepID=UPI0007002E0C|nr:MULTISPECIES: major capsid protein [Methylobacterium]KQP33823.1 hypothetical protein ASF49_08120 [Methylobacterium sp. Leaf104]MCI9879609.1 major capsid protein [Methylobacterium goesingense]
MSAERNPDPFHYENVTDAINKLPVVEDGLAGIIPESSSECMTDRVQVDMEQGFVQVLPITGRGGNPTPNLRNKRDTVDLKLPVYEVTDTLHERELLVPTRETGSIAMRTAETYRNQIITPMAQSITLTRGFQRAKGWLEGRIYDNDGAVWMDVFKRLGETQIVNEWDLTDSKFSLGDTIVEQKEEIEDELGSYSAERYVIVSGRNANRRLRKNKQAKEAMTDAGRFFIQQKDARKGIPILEDVDIVGYGRTNYKKPDGTLERFVDDDYAYMVPIGQGLARAVAGPSDMKQFRGQILDMYASIRELDHGKGEEMLVQACFLHFFARPRAVVKIRVIGDDE